MSRPAAGHTWNQEALLRGQRLSPYAVSHRSGSFVFLSKLQLCVPWRLQRFSVRPRPARIIFARDRRSTRRENIARSRVRAICFAQKKVSPRWTGRLHQMPRDTKQQGDDISRAINARDRNYYRTRSKGPSGFLHCDLVQKKRKRKKNCTTKFARNVRTSIDK